MPQLLAPTADLHPAWLAAHDEWGPGLHEDGFGLGPDDDVRTTEGFATWVRSLREAGTDRGDGAVASWWIVEDGEVLGGIALRHGITPERTRAVGNLGYGVRPTARGRGVATWAVGEVLGRASSYGLEEIAVVCLVANRASARVVEAVGGVLSEVWDTPDGAVRRYRVQAPPLS